MPVTIEPYASADEVDARDLERMVDIYNRSWDEWIPGEPPMTVDAFREDDRFTHPPEVVVRRLARSASGDVVGLGYIEFREGPGACVLSAFVAPEHRRQGVGTALGTALIDAARQAGRAGVTVEAPEGGYAGAICERAGFKPDMVVEQNRALVEAASDELLQRWVAEGEVAEGYSLVTYDDVCPDDELAADFIAARHVMNDAPRWEGEPASEFTVEELRAAESAANAARLRWWSVGVRHDGTGALVGLSEIYLPESRPWIVYQGDTGVDPAHRGHRLGAWMKAVNHLRLKAERPDVQVVQTWNASANQPMLRINRALGFQPIKTYRGWYLPFA